MFYYKVDLSDFEGLDQQFRKLKRVYPHVTRTTLNTAAFAAQGVAKKKVQKEFVLRNKWTAWSIKVAKVRTLRIEQQESMVGSVDDYMERQEFGGILRKKGRVGKPIYTAYSASRPEGEKPVMKLPTRTNKLMNIKISKGRKRRRLTEQQKAIVAVKTALKKGARHVFLDSGTKTGLYRVIKRGKGGKIKMVHSLARKHVVTPATPWLRPSALKIEREIPAIYRRMLVKQAKRNRLFGY